MKITIDLEDLVNDLIEEGVEDQFNLKEEIKNSIVRSVAYQRFDKEIESMREQAKNLFKGKISEKIDEVVAKQVERIIKEDKFKYNSYEDEKTLSEYIKDRYIAFTRNGVNLDEITKKIANKAAEELKDRYDLLFASQMVSRLDQLGLLKEDAAKILLENKNDNR